MNASLKSLDMNPAVCVSCLIEHDAHNRGGESKMRWGFVFLVFIVNLLKNEISLNSVGLNLNEF